MSNLTIKEKQDKEYDIDIVNNKSNKTISILLENIPAVEDAIIKSGGWLTKAAELLGCSSRHLALTVARVPSLIELTKDVREKYNDIAEIKLLSLVKEGNLEAIKYWLNYQAKDRGWGVKDTAIDTGVNITFSVEPAFSMDDIKNQAELRIKEIKMKECVNVKAREIISESKEVSITDNKIPVKEIIIEQNDQRTKDFVDITNEGVWQST